MKKVSWGAPKVTSALRKPGTYGSFQEFLAKANSIKAEQEQAEEYLKKSLPVMVALLEHKLRVKEPLVVMRPLRYQTSVLNTQDNDGFYKSSAGGEKFIDKIEVILPGTQLVIKSLDMGLQEFIFEDARGKEYALNFAERNNLLTQTSIFEEVKKFLETKGE